MAKFNFPIKKIKIPLFPIFAIIFPVVLPIFYLPEAFNHEAFLINLAWGLFISNLYLLFGIMPLALGAVVFIPFGIIEICHFILYKTPISKASIFVLLETNLNEASEFVTDNFDFQALLISITYLLFCAVIFNRDMTKFKSSFGGFRLKKGSVIISFLIFMVIFDRVIDQKYSIAFPATVSSVIEYGVEIQEYRRTVNNRQAALKKNIKATKLEPHIDELHVLVIGESTNKNHMSIYGYQRETTPLLKELKNKNEILVFKDVISPFTHTQPSLKTALTTLSSMDIYRNSENDAELKFYNAESIIDITKTAGYHVSWLSNQAQFGIWDNFLSIFSKTANNSVYVNAGACCNTVSFDEKLFSPFKKEIFSNEKKSKIIILHLMGTHGSYVKRYPFKFSNFNDWDSFRQRTINEYDNAILYNDYVINEIIDILKTYANKHSNSILTMTYFADHGEEVYDTQDFSGHDMYRLTPGQVEVPFVVWVSNSFKSVYPEKHGSMKNNISQPFVTDDLIYTFLDLTRVQTPLHKENRSLFNKSYQPKKRMVYSKDYDKWDP